MDNSFIRRFNERDELAFEIVFKATFPIMLGLAYKIIQNYQEGEDVVIVAYRKLWESDNKFDSYEKIKAFISTIVKNESINYLRKVRESAKRIKTLTDAFDIEDVVLTESYVSYELRKHIKRLPDHFKRLLLMQLDGYTDKDISAIESISIPMVARRRWRAIKMIKSLLNKI